MNKVNLFFYRVFLKVGFFIPDKYYLKIIYRLYMNKRLDLKDPKTFQEKIQWLKLYNRKEYYHSWVDKYEVKKYVASKVGEQYVIPTFGIYDTFDEIDFDKLPDKFVLKTTNGSHTNVICRKKSDLNLEEIKKKFIRFYKYSPYIKFREWAYKDVKPRIIAEKFMEDLGSNDLIDYKFFCFSGEVRYCQVIKDRSNKETIDFFDQNWNHQEFHGLSVCAGADLQDIEKPKNLQLMLDIAHKLSGKEPFIRVDLYEIKGKVYFGELTFYPAAGLGFFNPSCWDRKMGDLIHFN